MAQVENSHHPEASQPQPEVMPVVEESAIQMDHPGRQQEASSRVPTADDVDRKTVQRWITANEAASILLGNSGTHVPESLPIEVARERGKRHPAGC